MIIHIHLVINLFLCKKVHHSEYDNVNRNFHLVWFGLKMLESVINTIHGASRLDVFEIAIVVNGIEERGPSVTARYSIFPLALLSTYMLSVFSWCHLGYSWKFCLHGEDKIYINFFTWWRFCLAICLKKRMWHENKT